MTAIYVPLVRQAYDFSCGAASLASILYYWGVWTGREPELYRKIGTTTCGTSGRGIMQYAKSVGLHVSYETNMSIERLQQLGQEGNTIILSIQAWVDPSVEARMEDIWEDGHYVVFVGISAQDGLVYVMDPAVAGSYHSLTVPELLASWHDWSDDGETREFNTGIIIKGERAHPFILPVLD